MRALTVLVGGAVLGGLAAIALLAAACGRLGYDDAGELVDGDAGVGDPLRLSSIAAGGCHTCRVSGGAIDCWGCNQSGQLGVDDLEPRSAPTRLPALPGFDRIWAGEAHTCALRVGFLWCWGDNAGGQLGLGTTGGVGMRPARLDGNGWSDAALGFTHTCALTGGDALYCWGDNAGGQLGLGVEGGDHPAPAPVDGATFSQGRAARDSTCFIERDTGSLWCWGLALFGTAPAQVDAGVYRRIDVGGHSICAVGDGGGLLCSCAGDGCGGFDWGQVGDATDWIATSSGASHTCGLRAGGSLWCWGENADGQLGFGHRFDVTAPRRVGTAAWLAVSAGAHHTCAIRADETTWCWGRNSSGELGQGTTSEPVLAPLQVELP